MRLIEAVNENFICIQNSGSKICDAVGVIFFLVIVVVCVVVTRR